MPPEPARKSAPARAQDASPMTQAEVVALARQAEGHAAQARRAAEAAERHAKDAVAASNLQAMVVQRVETALSGLGGQLNQVIEAIGDEGYDERGEPVGTGIRGRVKRLEAKVRDRFRLYDDLRNFALGFAAAIGIAAVVIWWALGDKLGALLKP